LLEALSDGKGSFKDMSKAIYIIDNELSTKIIHNGCEAIRGPSSLEEEVFYYEY
jgi:hypothetical protein